MGQAAGMGTGSTTAPGGAHGDRGSPTAPGGVPRGGCSVVPTVTLPPGRGKWEGDSEKGKEKEK